MSILKVDAIRHNSATSDAITTHSDGTASAKIVDVAGGPLSNRNLIINGAMNVAQRSPNVAVNIPGGKTVTDVDRFGQWTKTADANWKSAQQVYDAPADFQFSRKITSLAANTIETGTYHTVRYAVEGYDAAQLNCGLSSAKTVTLSFYVKSSLTGTFGLNFTNGANNRSYPTTYTISNPNVWERKTITVTLDTSGTWLKTNGVGLEINWQLAIGSSYSTSTLNQWQGNWRFPSSATDILATNGATWQLTGVQLEVGDTATTFEHRSHGEELRRCYRYFQRLTSSDNYQWVSLVSFYSGSEIHGFLKHFDTMRAVPTLSADTGANTFAVQRAGGAVAWSTGIIKNGGDLNITYFYRDGVSLGTSGQCGRCLTWTAGSTITLDAEL